MLLATDECLHNQTESDDTVTNSLQEANGSLVSVADVETWRTYSCDQHWRLLIRHPSPEGIEFS